MPTGSGLSPTFFASTVAITALPLRETEMLTSVLENQGSLKFPLWITPLTVLVVARRRLFYIICFGSQNEAVNRMRHGLRLLPSS